jgi:WD40 repeat protein
MRRGIILVTLVTAMTAFAEPGPIPRVLRVDQDGDVLEEGTIARCGSRRFRDPDIDRISVDDAGRIVACFERTAVRWWDLTTGRYLRGWAPPKDTVPNYSSDGRLAAYKAGDSVEIWDTWNDRKLRRLPLHGDQKILATAFSKDKQSLAACTIDVSGTKFPVRHWQIDKDHETLVGHADAEPDTIEFADGDALVIISTNNFQLSGWDIRRQRSRWSLPLHYHHQIDHSGRRFVAEDARDESFRIFACATGLQVSDTPVLTSETKEKFGGIMALSPDSHTVLTSNLNVWDMRKGEVTNKDRKFQIMWGRNFVRWAATFTHDGKRIVLWNSMRLLVYDVAAMKLLTDSSPSWGQLQELQRVYWSTDGKRILTSVKGRSQEGPSYETWEWDANTGKLIGDVEEMIAYRELKQAPHLAYYGAQYQRETHGPFARDAKGRRFHLKPGVTHSADGALMACGRYDFEPPELPVEPPFIHCGGGPRIPLKMANPSVVETVSGRALWSLSLPHIGPIALSPNNRSLAVLHTDGVRLYDLLSGKEQLFRKIPTYVRHDRDLPAGDGMAFSPDGSRLAVIEQGGTILVLDVAIPSEPIKWKPDDADLLWATLAHDEPTVAWRTILHLTEQPSKAIEFFSRRLTPVQEPADAAGLIADLDSARFPAREVAMKKLLAYGESIQTIAARVLRDDISTEKRSRLETIQSTWSPDRSPPSADLRLLRALIVLERIASPDARKQTEKLTHGLPEARVTKFANAALTRLDERHSPRNGH